MTMRCMTGVTALLLMHSAASLTVTTSSLVQLQQPTPPGYNSSSCSSSGGDGGGGRLLWNFTAPDADVDSWHESSDGTARALGMSTGSLHIQCTQRLRRAVMFSLLNPQPNGAAFVGFYTRCRALDLSHYTALVMRCRAQGASKHYKFYLKDGRASPVATDSDGGSYEARFSVQPDVFVDVRVPLTEFVFYYRGRRNVTAPPPDLANVTLFGVQVYGGVYDSFKQRGVSSLEIDWIGVE